MAFGLGMKVLVTGAAGFIGSFTAQRFLSRGDEVVGLDNLNDYYDVALKIARLARLERQSGFRFERLDLADEQAMSALFAREKFEFVVHLGAQAGVRYSLQNPHAYLSTMASSTWFTPRPARSMAPAPGCHSRSTSRHRIHCRCMQQVSAPRS
jgi:nucleoside-diphosphate-sugar epimerase